MPRLSGVRIEVSFRPQLTVRGGKLYSGETEKGTAVYAASYIRERKIVLDSELLRTPRQLRLILLHEIFHFVWPRLSNRVRQEFTGLLRLEREQGTRGELGESASLKKKALPARGKHRSDRRWRDYVCESFCDTAAWMYSGNKRNREFTLSLAWRARRRSWFKATFASGAKC